MKNFLIVRPGAIGDALLTFPVLEALREMDGDMRITLVSNAQVLPLAQALAIADETFDFQDSRWSELFSTSGIRTSLLRDLLAQTVRAICWMRDPDGLIEHNLKNSGVKHTIIAPGRPPDGECLHIVDYLARTIGLPDIGTQLISRNGSQLEQRPSTSVGASVVRVRQVGLYGHLRGGDGQAVHQRSTSPGDSWQVAIQTPDPAIKHFVAIHPGSGSTEKCWPTIRFTGVIRRLWEQNHPVLLLAGPADTERVRDILEQLSLPPTPEMFQVLADAPFLELAQRLQQCRCYLGNDSGITHLAALLGVPTVAIFGPTEPKIWRPVGPFVKVLQGHSLGDVTVDDVIGCLDI